MLIDIHGLVIETHCRSEELLRELADLEHANVTPHRRSFFEKLKDYFVPEDTDSRSAANRDARS